MTIKLYNRIVFSLAENGIYLTNIWYILPYGSNDNLSCFSIKLNSFLHSKICEVLFVVLI